MSPGRATGNRRHSSFWRPRTLPRAVDPLQLDGSGCGQLGDASVALSDEQPPTDEARGLMLDRQAGRPKRSQVLLDGVQTHAVWLDELVDAIVAGDRPVEIECAHMAFAAVDRDAGYGETVPTCRLRHSVTESPLVWMDPRLDDQQPARPEVIGHVRHCSMDVVKSEQVPDAAEEAGHDVEAAVESKRSHVSEVERDVGERFLCALQHGRADVDTRDVGEAPAKAPKMMPGAAGDVEKRASVRTTGVDQFCQLVRLGAVVPTTRCLNEVVGVCAPLVDVHLRTIRTPRCTRTRI